MERNSFLKTSSLVVTSLFTPSLWGKLWAASAINSKTVNNGIINSAQDTKINIGEYFKWDRPEVPILVEKILDNCVFSKIMPPRGTLEHQWIMPGGYVGQWIWDTIS